MFFHSLQRLRGLAAMAVVLYHAHCYVERIGGKSDTFFRVFDERFSYGAWFFFVLSGFMMAFLIDASYPRFLIRRLTRIYPSFWLAAALTVVAHVLVFGSVQHPHLLNGVLLIPVGLDRASYPLGIEWTLIYEVFFYLVCTAFAARRLRGYFLPFLVTWAAAIMVGHLRFQTQTLFLPTFRQIPFSLFNLLFVIGGLTYYVSKAIQGRSIRWILTCGMFSAAGFLSGHVVTHEAMYFSSLGLGFAGLILCGVLWDRRRPTSTDGPDYLERWGDYSYGLYLVHVPVMSILMTKLHGAYRMEITGFIGVVAVATAIVAGWYYGKVDLVLHRYFKNFGSRPHAAETRSPGVFRPMAIGRLVSRGTDVQKR